MSHDVVKLDPILDISSVDELLTKLTAGFDKQAPLIIDATAVETITTPAVQALVSACKSFEASSEVFVVQAHSPAFQKAFETLGLFPIFKRMIF